jgi:L-amino acid N-acyltransferase YncA
MAGSAILQDAAAAPHTAAMGEPMIEPMRADDWPDVRRIYEEGIATGDATFETSAPDWPEWDAAHHAEPRLVARSAGAMVGWAALSPVSRRAVYAGVAEVSVYVSAAARGRGVGRALLRALVAASEAHGVWTLQAGIFPENVASVRLHESCGFRAVGRRERIGRLRGRWRDVLLLERRSRTTVLNAFTSPI